MVLLLASGGHGVVSHRAAARLHGLDGFDHAGMAVVEASVTRDVRLEIPATVVHHVTPLDELDRTTVRGFALHDRHRRTLGRSGCRGRPPAGPSRA